MSTKRIILYAVLGLLALGIGYIAYIFATTTKHSPQDIATFDEAGLVMSVDYCRPYKKGRTIFGPKDSEALQPFGEYWRAGANAATEIEINKDVNFGGSNLAKGRYVLYAIPGASEWTIGLNSELGRWGAREVDHDMDILQVKVPASKAGSVAEQFTIDFSRHDSATVHLNLKWDDTHVAVPISG